MLSIGISSINDTKTLQNVKEQFAWLVFRTVTFKTATRKDFSRVRSSKHLTVFSKVVDFLPLPSKTRLHHGLKSKSSLQSPLQSPLQESKLQTEFPWQQVSNKCYRNLSDFSSKWCSFSGKCCEKGEKSQWICVNWIKSMFKFVFECQNIKFRQSAWYRWYQIGLPFLNW